MPMMICACETLGGRKNTSPDAAMLINDRNNPVLPFTR
jgi:hypothetical protein